MVTALFVLTTTGAGETALQTAGETRFVVDCRAKPVALAGQVKTTFVPERMMVRRGRVIVTVPKERLNTVP